MTYGGLHEFDSSGNIIRSWWNQCFFTCKSNVTLRLPAGCPINSDKVAAIGDLLAFTEKSNLYFASQVSAWNPRTDTWYGPLGVGKNVHGTASQRPYGARGGLWLPMSDGILFLGADDLLTAARKAGRVMTSAEYRRRQEELIATMPLLDQAKIAVSMREFDKAERLLNAALASDSALRQGALLAGHSE